MFTRAGDEWVEVQKLTASDAQPGDHFGASIAIDGDNLIIGATVDDDHGLESASAYVFNRQGEEWVEQQKLIGSDVAAGHRSAGSVSIDGDTIVFSGGMLNGPSGSAYVFTRSGESWFEQQKLTLSTASRSTSSVPLWRSKGT